MAKLNNIQTTFLCPTTFTPQQRELLGELIIKKIQERTQAGIKAKGGVMPAYSKSYKESLDFKIAGKSAGEVNLTLTGDMLASMKIVRHSIGKVVIGYDQDDDLADQVEGNQIGSYGKKIGNPDKARPFIGLPDGILRVLIAQVDDETTDIKNTEVKKLAERIRDGLSTVFNDEDD